MADMEVNPAVYFSYAPDSDVYDINTEHWNYLRFTNDLRYTATQEFRSEYSQEEFLKELVDAFKLTLYTWTATRKIEFGNRIYQSSDVLVKLNLDKDYYYVICSGKSEGQVKEVMEWVAAKLPQVPRKDPTVVPLKFWTMTNQGPKPRVREIKVPRWDEVTSNYPAQVRDQVGKVMALRTPENAGRLLLWHGPPGTGKTHAIRAIIKEWAPWCNGNYITDPEKFFGSAEYMMSVLLEQDHTNPTFSEEQEEIALWGQDRWILLIIEDAEEFLVAKEVRDSGQSLSRLLNLADGLIGQGINLLILITTNEKIGKIHPAISRDGRCISNIEFPAFPPSEAQQWLAEHEVKQTVGNDQTLAQLYSELRAVKQIKSESKPVTAGTYL